MILNKINKPNDIKNLNKQELGALPQEMRQFLLEHLSVTGGHLASNLGVVELTMALHLSLDLPQDKIIWDVGHQSYPHKMLTGRMDGFKNLRMYQGMSGFPKRKENDCDSFDTGHSSTSISAGLGYVKGRDIKGEDYRVVAVIGDGSLTGGMAYEALNNAATLDTNYIIVLNDNNMSISENVGGMSRYLDSIRTGKVYNGIKHSIERGVTSLPLIGEPMANTLRRAKDSVKQLFVPGMFFEDMGLTYLGPIDGHNLKDLRRAMDEAKKVEGAVLLHVMTDKGKGYTPAEKEPGKFHGTGPFNLADGSSKSGPSSPSYTDVFGSSLCELAQDNKDIVAITAAMSTGTGLDKFGELYPKRFFDVGIAEQHGVTFAAGLAAAGLKPVIALYSSFLQRAYDQVIHDICIQELPVVIGIDRAGLVGNDGETHQGIFDISFLMSMPNMTIMAPKSAQELKEMLTFAVDYDGPIALRYARGAAFDDSSLYGNISKNNEETNGANSYAQKENQNIDMQRNAEDVANGEVGLEKKRITYGKSEVIYQESDIAILVVGHMMESAVEVYKSLKEKGQNASLINARFVKPIDEEMVLEVAKNHSLIVTIEENVISGAYGSEVRMCLGKHGLDTKVLNLGIDDQYVEHGSISALRKEVGLDVDSMINSIENNMLSP